MGTYFPLSGQSATGTGSAGSEFGVRLGLEVSMFVRCRFLILLVVLTAFGP